MSVVHTPDPHPGRCPNLRPSTDGYGYPVNLRCLGYADRPHQCSFGEAAQRLAGSTFTSWTPPKPKPWVSPLDEVSS